MQYMYRRLRGLGRADIAPMQPLLPCTMHDPMAGGPQQLSDLQESSRSFTMKIMIVWQPLNFLLLYNSNDVFALQSLQIGRSTVMQFRLYILPYLNIYYRITVTCFLILSNEPRILFLDDLNLSMTKALVLWVVLFLPLPSSSSVFLRLPPSSFLFLPLPPSSSLFLPLPPSSFLFLPSSSFLPLPSSSFLPLPSFLFLPSSTSLFLPSSSFLFFPLPPSSSLFLPLGCKEVF